MQLVNHTDPGDLHKFLPEASFGLQVLSLPASLCPSIHVCGNHLLVCVITRDPFKYGGTYLNIQQLLGDKLVRMQSGGTTKSRMQIYRKVSNIRRTLVDNKIVDHSDVVGASPVGAAPTTSSFST